MQNALGLGKQPLLCPGVATVQPQEASDQNLAQEAPPGPLCGPSREASGLAEDLGGGDSEDILPLVYQHLRHLAAGKLARERPGQTLQATALVHEAWLRLEEDLGQRWDNQQHFISAAAEAMRRILIENARRKKAARHGGGLRRTESAPDDLPNTGGAPDDELVEVDEALDALAAHDARKAELVKLRYFAGFTLEEAAAALNLSVRTAKRDWAYARAWLFREIGRRKEGI
jgi:RNA polymerase sigma factor (TIGR02999 family)